MAGCPRSVSPPAARHVGPKVYNPGMTICILLLSMNKAAPYEVRCTTGDKKALEYAQATCAAANRDPLGTCDAFVTSDGTRWFFVHQGVV